MRDVLRRANWILSAQFGIDVRKLVGAFIALPRFAADWRAFSRLARPTGVKLHFRPALHDRGAAAGVTDEYFWQDLVVAQMVHDAAPEKHVDVGSMLNGFVAHVASFRDIEVIDIRPVTQSIPRVTFVQRDVMTAKASLADYTPSLSCLHTIEHFGLGRYGDPLAADGPAIGIRNLAAMVQPGGVLYLSTPVGRERIEFNANWISDPRRICDVAEGAGLTLDRLIVVENGETSESHDFPAEIARLQQQPYALAIFVLRKRGSN